MHQNLFYEILHIFKIKNNLFFLCSPYIIKNLDYFLNSFEIEKNDINEHQLIQYSDLLYTKSHEIKTIQGSNYVISNSLDLKYNLNQF